jgi:hypothetical protein
MSQILIKRGNKGKVTLHINTDMKHKKTENGIILEIDHMQALTIAKELEKIANKINQDSWCL